ncbi:MAG: ABC transporter ATP-binding protein [Caldilineaceae bacterium]
MSSLLEVNQLKVYFRTPRGIVKAVDDVSFTMNAGERFGLIGESGSGKSTLAFAILRLIKPPGYLPSGELYLNGRDLSALSDEEMRQVRLADIALVTQGAMNALNPVSRICDQFADGLRSHGLQLSNSEQREHLAALLRSVGLPPDVANMYPHQLSGGMKQRACIALAISLRPKLIIADEPTSALDVVVQRQVMQTLRQVQEELGAAVILIGHDMGLMAQFATRVGVMYAGKLVEEGPVRQIFHNPQHPYTQLLMASLPSLEEKEELEGTVGSPPAALERPAGCVFHPRCPHIMPRCKVEEPGDYWPNATQRATCFLLDDTAIGAKAPRAEVSA